jgi:hypothetical protein
MSSSIMQRSTPYRKPDGWIEENPFIPSDHGIVWIALDRSKLKGINQRKGKKQQQRETRNDNIRLKGAQERMHEKYTGVPVRIMGPLPHTTKDSHVAQVLLVRQRILSRAIF